MKYFAFILSIISLASPTWSAIALSTNTAVSGVHPTSPAIDTSGSTLLIMGQSCQSGVNCLAPTDNKSNKWVSLSQKSPNAFNFESIWYSSNPVVGTGHTFTGEADDAGLCVMAFSGTDTSITVLDKQNGAASATSPLATGSITPSTDGQLIVSYIGTGDAAATMSVNSSLTITNQIPNSGSAFAQACAYFVQTTAAAINPNWSWTGTIDHAASVGSFKASGAAVAAAVCPAVMGSGIICGGSF